MPKVRIHYETLGAAFPCTVLKLMHGTHPLTKEQLAPYVNNAACVCVLQGSHLYYFHKTKDTFAEIDSNIERFNELFAFMDGLTEVARQEAPIEVCEMLSGMVGHALPVTATTSEIKKAYTKLCLTHHPDKGGDAGKFREIQVAYEILSDPEKRAAYDSSSYDILDEFLNTIIIDDVYNAFNIITALSSRHPELYAEIINPERDFTQCKNAEILYKLRASQFNVLFTLAQKEPYEGNVLTEKTKKSFSKHCQVGHFKDSPSDKFFKPFYEGIAQNLSASFRQYVMTTTERYQNTSQMRKALSQPFRGLLNLSRAFVFGLICITLGPFLLSNTEDRKELKQAFRHTSSVFLLGLFQLAGTPITWGIHFPIRYLHTKLKGLNFFEDNYHTKRVVQEAEQAVEKNDKHAVKIATTLLHRKVRLAINKNKKLRHSVDTEQSLYQEIDRDFVLGTLTPRSTMPITQVQKEHLTAYLGLFKPVRAAPFLKEEQMACNAIVVRQ